MSSAAAAEIVLYGTRLCPFVQRTRMLLHHKQLAFKDTPIDLLHKPTWFRVRARRAARRDVMCDVLAVMWRFFASPYVVQVLSPFGKVPVLEHGPNVVYESAAINQYIDETWRARPLMAAAPYERAMERVATHWANTRLAKEMYHVVFGIRATAHTPDTLHYTRVLGDAQRVMTAHEVATLTGVFDELEARLVRCAAVHARLAFGSVQLLGSLVCWLGVRGRQTGTQACIAGCHPWACAPCSTCRRWRARTPRAGRSREAPERQRGREKGALLHGRRPLRLR